MAMIEVDGKKYKVMESLGYQHGAGPAKFVETPDGERVAVKRGGIWTWWTARDRLFCGGRNVVGMSNTKAQLPERI